MPWDKHNAKSVWSDEAVELLRTGWNGGKSAAQIACDLNNKFKIGVSRNAVIGKAFRLRKNGDMLVDRRADVRLVNRRRAATRPKRVPRQKAVTLAEVPAPAPKREDRKSRRSERAEARAATRTLRSEIMAGDQERGYIDEFFRRSTVAVPSPRSVPIYDVGRGCRWPVGYRVDGMALFCGCDRASGHQSYCKRHAVLGTDVSATDRSNRKGEAQAGA